MQLKNEIVVLWVWIIALASTLHQGLAAPPALSRQDQFSAALRAQNVPINFWGKVVDQSNAPLADVEVKVNVREWKGIVSDQPSIAFNKHSLRTDSKGSFQILGETGDVLTVESLRKEGYAESPRMVRGYGYNISTNITPNPANPIVFRMWQKGEKAKLAKAQVSYKLVPDGRSYTIDLLNKRQVEGNAEPGDLRVSITRPKNGDPKMKYDWRFSLDVVGGGVQETDDEFLFLAPENGYQSHYTLECRADDPNWKERLLKRFFIKARDGAIYGSLTVEIISKHNDQSAFRVTSVLNAGGSRTLE